MHIFILCFQIISGNFRSKAINSVSDDLLKAGERLEAINPDRRKCLVTFTDCLELVTWLRESIKGKNCPFEFRETIRMWLL